MKNSEIIKLVPKGNLTVQSLRMESRNTYWLSGIDEEGDEFIVAQIVCYLNEHSLDAYSYSSNEDYQKIRRMRKMKNIQKVFIDYIEVMDGYQRQGFGTIALNQFCAIMQQKGVEAVCLKAYPLIVYQWDSFANKVWKQIKEERDNIQNFYKKNGFTFINKGMDLMVKVL